MSAWLGAERLEHAGGNMACRDRTIDLAPSLCLVVATARFGLLPPHNTGCKKKGDEEEEEDER